MTRVDFYQIESNELPLRFTCRLIETIFDRGLRIYVHAASAQQAAELDVLLWSYRADRFIPHALAATRVEAPIVIGTGQDPDGHGDVLVNLADQVPEFFSRFERVTEVVPPDDAHRAAAREHYRFYRERGYPLEYHQIGG